MRYGPVSGLMRLSHEQVMFDLAQRPLTWALPYRRANVRQRPDELVNSERRTSGVS